MKIGLTEPFVDDRGSIQNLVSIPESLGVSYVGNVALITSKRGAVRSNHYHKNDWHYIYVLSGQMLYFEREAGSRPTLLEPALVSKGEMIHTRANQEHAVLFLEDSEIVSIARNAQTTEEHEGDTVKVDFLSREWADKFLAVYR